MTTITISILGMAAVKIHLLFLMVPATLSASFVFMLPAAKPSNGNIFSSSGMSILKMSKAGLAFNLIGLDIVLRY